MEPDALPKQWQPLLGLFCSNEQNKFKDVLKRLIEVDFYVPSELDGDVSCFYCNAYLSGGENHEDDCPYIEAKKALGILKI